MLQHQGWCAAWFLTLATCATGPGPVASPAPTAAPTTTAPPTSSPPTSGPGPSGPGATGPTATAPTATAPTATAPTATAPTATAPTATAPTATAPTATAPTATAPTGPIDPTASVPTTAEPTAPTATAPSAPPTGAASTPPGAGAPPGDTPPAPAGTPIAAPPIAPQAGVPFSITFEIVGGSAQDAVHAIYKPGSSLQLRAVIRDAYGNIVNNTAQNACTPEFWLENTGTPSGASRATLAGDVVTFGDGLGPFTAAVRCREHPEINSTRNEAPFQFETNNGAFAHEAHVQPPAAPAAHGGNQGLSIVIGLALGGAVAYLVYELTVDAAGGSCSISNPCVCSYGGADCTNLGDSYCSAKYGLGSCVSAYPQCTCDSTGTTSRTVERLVASGLHESRANYPVSTVSRVARTAPASPAHVAPASPGRIAPSHSFMDNAGTVLLLGGLATAVAAMISSSHLELRPWIGPTSSGLGATFTF